MSKQFVITRFRVFVPFSAHWHMFYLDTLLNLFFPDSKLAKEFGQTSLELVDIMSDLDVLSTGCNISRSNKILHQSSTKHHSSICALL